MEGQRHKAPRGRRRRKARPKSASAVSSEPILIVARRPDAPRVKTPNRSIAASAKPRRHQASVVPPPETTGLREGEEAEKPRRSVRIIQATPNSGGLEATRVRLLQRLLDADGRIAITRAAEALREQQIEVPEEQEHQVQLLDHNDERRARDAISVIRRLLERQPPKKRPIMERRLRRLEQEADEAETRQGAAALLKTIRAA
jgi:hypothetical protein